MSQVLTANRLGDGRVVFLASDHAWSTRLADARVADDETQAQALTAAGEAAQAQCLVVGCYLVPVRVSGAGALSPESFRERIRALGPTVQTESH